MAVKRFYEPGQWNSTTIGYFPYQKYMVPENPCAPGLWRFAKMQSLRARRFPQGNLSYSLRTCSLRRRSLRRMPRIRLGRNTINSLGGYLIPRK